MYVTVVCEGEVLHWC